MESKEQKLIKRVKEMMFIGCNSLYNSGETESCPFNDSESICGDCLLDEATKLLNRLLVEKCEDE